MRNRRLLTLAVLAVALGCAAFAQAETAVVTVVENGLNYDIRYSISGGTSIGSTASTPGALDIVFKGITGLTDADLGDEVGTDLSIVAPSGTVQLGALTAPAGFSGNGSDANDHSIANLTYDDANGFSMVLLQPAAYDDPCSPAGQNDLQDAGVLNGVGTLGSTGYSMDPNYDGVTTVGAIDYDGDTKVLSGTMTSAATTGWSVGVTTYGTDSFDVLPWTQNMDGNGRYEGPMDSNMFVDSPDVQAVVMIQTNDANGVGGGTVVAQSTTVLTVKTGSVTLGSSFASGTQDLGAGNTVANMAVVVPKGTTVTLGQNHVLTGLDIEQSDANGTVDVDAYRVAIYAGDETALAAAEADALADILGGDLTSSDTRMAFNGGSGSMTIGFVLKTDDVNDPNYLEVGAGKTGDGNFDDKIDGSDAALVNINWDTLGTGTEVFKYYKGDLNLDGKIDGSDAALINIWWNTLGNPVTGGGAAVPEPATLGLLALGAIGLIRRRRA